jgi:hypothetical protein
VAQDISVSRRVTELLSLDNVDKLHGSAQAKTSSKRYCEQTATVVHKSNEPTATVV